MSSGDFELVTAMRQMLATGNLQGSYSRWAAMATGIAILLQAPAALWPWFCRIGHFIASR
jgi:hypothetical protein